MNVSNGPLAGLLIIEPRVFKDERGYFYESYHQERYSESGIPAFVQDNVSHSKQNVIRGLHYQLGQPQGKLVWVTRGTVWDVVVDLRISSPTFGHWTGITLSDKNNIQLYIPPGFAHGFCVQSEEADFYYKCTDFYNPNAERGIIWNDQRLNIPWPITGIATISAKDRTYPGLDELSHDQLFA